MYDINQRSTNGKKKGNSMSKRNNRSVSNQKMRKQANRKKAQNAKRTQKRRGMTTGKKILVGICVVLLIFVIVAIVGVAYFGSKMGKLNVAKLNVDALSISDELSYDESGYLNVALFGLDKRANNDEMGERSDTIMVASLNRETKEVKISSVYRDTLLQQKDGTYNKANSAYSFGGAEQAIAMLNKNLDLDIQHYVTVDFAALVDVIDALGGIDIDVTDEEVEYLNGYIMEIIENTGVNTVAVEHSGLQTLSGVQATAYARIRYTSGDDFKRAERQRLVLAKIAEKAQKADLATINKIIDKVFPKIETNFTLKEILAYAKDAMKYQLADTTGFPEVKDTMDYEDAGNVVVPLTLESNVRTLHQYLFGEDGYTPSSTLSAINSELESISQNGSMGTTDSSDSYYNDGYTDYSDQGYDGSNQGYGDGINYDDSTTYDPGQTDYNDSNNYGGDYNYGYDSSQSDTGAGY
ncbi:MAG: LCP family protein [Ruminococcus sp.]|uniref:LCP family glycopolymer transferase n=1 Tax=Ruminococcus sp. TaxID=41978 RepID=UPI003992B90A